jgi:hypothetical protein
VAVGVQAPVVFDAHRLIYESNVLFGFSESILNDPYQGKRIPFASMIVSVGRMDCLCAFKKVHRSLELSELVVQIA